jgi:hypothetical protein
MWGSDVVVVVVMVCRHVLAVSKGYDISVPQNPATYPASKLFWIVVVVAVVVPREEVLVV